MAIELIGGQLDEEQSVGNGDRHITITFLSERHYDATEIMPPPTTTTTTATGGGTAVVPAPAAGTATEHTEDNRRPTMRARQPAL